MILQNITNLGNTLFLHLNRHPETGVTGGALSFVLGFTNTYDKYMAVIQVIGATAGALLAVLALYVKFVQPLLKKRKKCR